METSFFLRKLDTGTHYKHQLQYVTSVTCEIRLISTKRCLI